MHWLAVSIVLSVLSQLSTKTLAVPVSRTPLQNNNSNHVEVKEEGEPFYTYVYEYDDEENQIWTDCSKLKNIWHSHSVLCNYYSSCLYHFINFFCMNAGQDQSVMVIQEIELDPNPPQKGEPITVSVKTKLCEF